MADSAQTTPLTSFDELLAPFFAAIKPTERHRIGAEAEKFGVDKATGAALPYDGEVSVLRVLHALVEEHGWQPDYEQPGGPLIALRRGLASVTLEPGGQLELSGAPLEDIHLVHDETTKHLAELSNISAKLGLAWLGLGFHPFARQSDLTWVPKARYSVMREYLPTRGAHAIDMMRRSATVQANFDYESEAAAMRKVRVALRLSPLVTAMFANSPLYEGSLFGGRSYRASVWLDVDPDRQGLIREVFERGERFEQYINWALDVPMFLFKRHGQMIKNTGQTFRSFMSDGYEGERPTAGDWTMHLNTLFPEVRLKQTIEVRGADSLPAGLSAALPALWTGILYDARALDEAEALTHDFGYDEVEATRPDIARRGLMASFRGQPLARLAETLLDIASGGLERRARLNAEGKDERVHLENLAGLVAEGLCPADRLVLALNGKEGNDLIQAIVLNAHA